MYLSRDLRQIEPSRHRYTNHDFSQPVASNKLSVVTITKTIKCTSLTCHYHTKRNIPLLALMVVNLYGSTTRWDSHGVKHSWRQPIVFISRTDVTSLLRYSKVKIRIRPEDIPQQRQKIFPACLDFTRRKFSFKSSPPGLPIGFDTSKRGPFHPFEPPFERMVHFVNLMR